MNKFIIKSLLFFTIIVILFISIRLLELRKVSNKSDYLSAIIDKHRHAENIYSPKIVFAGGSNLAFGIDSKKIEEEIGLPVINLGLNAGLGLTFILNELKYTINKNDIVFLSLEYFIENEGDYKTKKYTAKFYPECKKYFNTNYSLEVKDYLEEQHIIFKNIFTDETNNVINYDTTIYSRKSFNEYGDNTKHLNMLRPVKLNDRSSFSYTKWEGINEINRFNEFAKHIQVNTLFLFPPYPSSEYQKNRRSIELLESDLLEFLNVELPNKSIDFVYPDSCFFDTIYHLNKKGREKRTEKLIEIFKENPNIQTAIRRAKIGNNTIHHSTTN